MNNPRPSIESLPSKYSLFIWIPYGLWCSKIILSSKTDLNNDECLSLCTFIFERRSENNECQLLQNWLEREVKIISFDREDNYDIEEDYTCPLCCVVTKYILVMALVTFFSIIPFFMIYIGLTYQYCEDLFSVWLLAGIK